MTKKGKYITGKEFRKYLTNKMSNRERNKFERFLQQNPFEAEAIEGLQELTQEEISPDLQYLYKHIHPNRQKKKFPYWAAAASVLLIITSGILITRLIEKTPVPQVTENRMEKEKVETDDAVTEHIDKEKMNNPVAYEKDTTGKLINGIAPDEKKSAGVGLKVTSLHEKKSTNLVREKVVSAVDNETIPGVSILAKGTNTGYIAIRDTSFKLPELNDTAQLNSASFAGTEQSGFKFSGDSKNVAALTPSISSLDEVVVTGSGKKGSHRAKEATSNQDLKVQPIGGFDDYYKYLNKKCILPDEVQIKNKVVKIKLTINPAGIITKIETTNSPDSLLFEIAKEIISGRPGWTAEIKNGNPVESKVELKLKFSKQ